MLPALDRSVLGIFRADNGILLIHTQACKLYQVTNRGWPLAFLSLHRGDNYEPSYLLYYLLATETPMQQAVKH